MGIFGKKVDPQAAAWEALAGRKVSFGSRELNSLCYSAGGQYFNKPRPEDQRNLATFTARFSDGEYWHGVAYLVAEPGGDVAVQVNGVTIDHLTDESAALAISKLDVPQPVRCQVTRFVSASTGKARYHVNPKTGTTPF
jgi:hypothetical protein